MHVRVAKPFGGAGLILLVLAALTIASAPACRRAAGEARDVTISWSTAAPPVAGTATSADVTLRDAAARPVVGARVELQAFMPHPGMPPLLATATEGDAGVYRAQLRFTMAGPWTVLIKGFLADGRALNKRIDIPDVRPAAR